MLDFTAQCFETGKYDGNIKKNGGINIDVDTISNVEDPESCQKECLKNLECKFWTYNNEFAKWKGGRKKCWLHNANAPETKDTCTTCTRGPKNCPTTTTTKTTTTTTNTTTTTTMSGNYYITNYYL